MNYGELPILFSCGSESLLGILAQSESPGSVGVLIAVGGPQYRVGSHRQFVLLARSLAAAGYSVFRFDYRGMGDSTGDLRPFEDVVEGEMHGDAALDADIRKQIFPNAKR